MATPKKINAGKAKKLVPLIKKFNGIAQILINSLTNKIQSQEKEIQRINLVVQGGKVPLNKPQHTINIQNVGTSGLKKSKSSLFDMWNKKKNDNPERRNRGTII